MAVNYKEREAERPLISIGAYMCANWCQKIKWMMSLGFFPWTGGRYVSKAQDQALGYLCSTLISDTDCPSDLEQVL